MTSIKQCTCKHEGQDKLHGKQNRIFNIDSTKCKCTVCGIEKSI